MQTSTFCTFRIFHLIMHNAVEVTMPTENERPLLRNSISPLLSLPHELLHFISSSITNFQPWTFTSIREHADPSIDDKDLLPHVGDFETIDLRPAHRTVLGLSSEYGWLTLVLSRHPYHLSRSDKTGISPAITQALRRANAQLEQMHCAEGEPRSTPIYRSSRRASRISPTDNAACQKACMQQYHAHVHLEEETCPVASSGAARLRTARSYEDEPSGASALIACSPAPVLKLSSQDIARLASQLQSLESTEDKVVAMAAILITLVQCRLALLADLDKCEPDSPIPSIELSESTVPATPKTGPRHDRLRSMSGSTVAEAVVAQTQSLSLSPISTTYCSGRSRTAAVSWAEKRVSEERDVGTAPKRPRLMQYKQVSSGRVATLMDQFEKFHL
ncbi:uncharacterized protein M421DRAFT_351691 [Didymella exigua CBS 183.55]|uniref:Uncharacterized protein n=1 Tax=Didymella exigua CBS 183.55 TaxID=1150837 RepID=A0A6A5R4N6_9PLEO|nr:uncharacterized protein M421DRAFT_351691 [Didymella exigua CBS 183.55]KAF1922652.1 hypothetical protein M421DRAFT_351691 [Didymella exigua CBS 183.55]